MASLNDEKSKTKYKWKNSDVEMVMNLTRASSLDLEVALKGFNETSWTNLYKKAKKSKSIMCAQMSCRKEFEEASTVQTVNEGIRWFLIPFCADCAKTIKTKILLIKEGTRLLTIGIEVYPKNKKL